MTQEGTLVRKPVTAERRPPIATRLSAPAAAVPSVSTARALQRRLGNVGTQALATQVVARSSSSGVAPTGSTSGQQISISHPDDASEREAERVADVIVRMPEPATARADGPPYMRNSHAALIQRRCAQCEEEDKSSKVHRKETSALAPEVSPAVSDAVHSIRGGGTPLPATARAFFEPRFGADFSSVRVHADANAAETARGRSVIPYMQQARAGRPIVERQAESGGY